VSTNKLRGKNNNFATGMDFMNELSTTMQKQDRTTNKDNVMANSTVFRALCTGSALTGYSWNKGLCESDRDPTGIIDLHQQSYTFFSCFKDYVNNAPARTKMNKK
jgi:hypothetical protein